MADNEYVCYLSYYRSDWGKNRNTIIYIRIVQWVLFWFSLKRYLAFFDFIWTTLKAKSLYPEWVHMNYQLAGCEPATSVFGQNTND